MVLAVDVGGTKIAAGLVDRDGGLLVSSTVPTPSSAGATPVWDALASVVGQTLHSARAGRVVACGIGCGGPMTSDGETVSPLNIGAWRDFPLRARVAELTGLPTYLDNDAKALALAEGWCGTAARRRAFMAMVVSTGIGGGIMLDGRMLGGRLGNAGHVGHVVVEPNGRRCACGGHGCLEAEASGTAIAAITGRTPEHATDEIVERVGMLVGRAVASVAALLDLELAVVAGSVALGYGSRFFAAAQKELSARARLSYCSQAVVVPSGLGIQGPLIGAGAVGWRGDQQR